MELPGELWCEFASTGIRLPSVGWRQELLLWNPMQYFGIFESLAVLESEHWLVGEYKYRLFAIHWQLAHNQVVRDHQSQQQHLRLQCDANRQSTTQHRCNYERWVHQLR